MFGESESIYYFLFHVTALAIFRRAIFLSPAGILIDEAVKMENVQIAIIGSGFGGIGTAIRLKQEGFEEFIIFERADDVGGVWRDNTYPGCACDVQSHLYSLSFVPNPDWTHSFSPQAEIWDYLRKCARDYAVLPHIRFGHNVTEAVWEPDRQRWRIETSAGTCMAALLISAAGSFSEPKLPELAGLKKFKGKMFHSSRWDHQFEIKRSRIAVIGTGASAIQFVPAIQPQVEQLHVFQRTAPWIVPRHDRPFANWNATLSALPNAAALDARGYL